ncbi:hypothetical protein AVEN_186212-1 [Araneus ventricosus]|uniref:Uncharacterized protein n=1 Tax=Araneus ventricosus TaxID=182803 RepID=A0A4Y2TEM0_ARAVE|nr:hypothetical protein AVEN_186212-1 [Araneus ventricosus]
MDSQPGQGGPNIRPGTPNLYKQRFQPSRPRGPTATDRDQPLDQGSIFWAKFPTFLQGSQLSRPRDPLSPHRSVTGIPSEIRSLL